MDQFKSKNKPQTKYPYLSNQKLDNSLNERVKATLAFTQSLAKDISDTSSYVKHEESFQERLPNFKQNDLYRQTYQQSYQNQQKPKNIYKSNTYNKENKFTSNKDYSSYTKTKFEQQEYKPLSIGKEQLQFQDDEFLPNDVYYLLAEEDVNLAKYREFIEKEKFKLENDFENFQNDILNQISQIRNNLLTQFDDHYKTLMEFYKDFKQKVYELKETKKEAPTNSISNKSFKINNISNMHLLKELEEMKVQQFQTKQMQLLQQQIKNDQKKVISSSKRLLQYLSSHNNIYCQDKGVSTLNDIKNNFLTIIKRNFNKSNNFIQEIPKIKLDQYSVIQKLSDQGNEDSLYQEEFSQYSKPIPLQQQEVQQESLFKTIKPKGKFIERDSEESEIEELNENLEIAKPFPLKIQDGLYLENDMQLFNNVDIVQGKENGLNLVSSILVLKLLSKQRLALGLRNGEIVVYNLQQLNLVQVLKGHTTGICSLESFSQNNTEYLVSGSDVGDSTIVVWNCEKFIKHAKLKGHTAAVTSLNYNYQNNCLFSVAYDKEIILWDPVKGMTLQRILQHKASISISKTFENIFISCSLDGEIIFWKFIEQQLKIQKSQGFILENLVTSINFLQQKRKVILGTKKGCLLIFNLQDNKFEIEIPLNRENISEIAIIESNNFTNLIIQNLKSSEIVIYCLENQFKKIFNLGSSNQVIYGCGLSPKLQVQQNEDVLQVYTISQENSLLGIWDMLLLQQLIILDFWSDFQIDIINFRPIIWI